MAHHPVLPPVSTHPMPIAKGPFSWREQITEQHASENSELNLLEDMDGKQSENFARDELRIRKSDLP